MGTVTETITLVNNADITRANDGRITEGEIRQLTVEALVDTGAMSLVMGEETCKRLGLGIVKESTALLAGGVKQPCKITAPVIIKWKDRDTSIRAVVLPGRESGGKEKILLGVIPLEDMDLRVNPVDSRLEGVHGDEWVHYVR